MNRFARQLPVKNFLRHFCQAKGRSDVLSYKFVVLGGGAGGLAVASFLAKKYPNQVAVVEPSNTHYYQPLWTLVGAGLKNVKQSTRPMESVMPPNAQWVQDRVEGFSPDENTVFTEGGRQLKYEYLVVALGLQLDFHKIPGLPEALGTDGVGCNYSIDTVQDTFRELQKFKQGNAFFTLPNTPIKCLGAPQKIMYLADEIMRKNGVRNQANIYYKTAGAFIFAVEKYRNALMKICVERNLHVDTFRELVEIDHTKKEVTFEFIDDIGTPKKRETYNYGFIHVTPPMGPVDAVKGSSLVNAAGFVEVNKETLQHIKYENVFALGDCSSCPTSKTAAAVASESEVVRQNLFSAVNGGLLKATYNGYASCPLLTSSKTCILAEFDYTGLPLETFPVDQSVERRSMYLLKAFVMPEIYWNGLIKGIWGGPGTIRKMMHLGRV